MRVDQDPQIADQVGDVDSDDTPSDVQRVRRRRLSAGWRWLSRLLARWRLVLLALAVLASVGLTTGLFFFSYRPDQHTDGAAAQAAITAASEGATAVLSYKPTSVDHDVAVAQSYLTGEFSRYYRDFSQHFVAPAVRQQDVQASATVLRAAVSELHPDSAAVLLFVHQTTTGKDKPEPVVTSSNVRVTLTRVNDSWLISQFEPV